MLVMNQRRSSILHAFSFIAAALIPASAGAQNVVSFHGSEWVPAKKLENSGEIFLQFRNRKIAVAGQSQFVLRTPCHRTLGFAVARNATITFRFNHQVPTPCSKTEATAAKTIVSQLKEVARYKASFLRMDLFDYEDRHLLTLKRRDWD